MLLKGLLVKFLLAEGRGDVAALVKSHMNGLQPFESTTEQTTETMPPSPPPSHKRIRNSCSIDDKLNYKLARAATPRKASGAQLFRKFSSV